MPSSQAKSVSPWVSAPNAALDQTRQPHQIGELVARVRQGESEAYETLVRLHYRSAYAVALGVLCHRADAEDAVQDAFLTALERIDDCRDPPRFSGWLLQIVRNRAKNMRDYRRLRRAADIEDGDPGTDDRSRPGGMERVELSRRLLQALSGLSGEQRIVVLLHDLEGWLHRDIAAALDFSEEMSRQHLFAARKSLRSYLERTAAAGEPV